MRCANLPFLGYRWSNFIFVIAFKYLFCCWCLKHIQALQREYSRSTQIPNECPDIASYILYVMDKVLPSKLTPVKSYFTFIVVPLFVCALEVLLESGSTESAAVNRANLKVKNWRKQCEQHWKGSREGLLCG